jgi:hypothetical protein
VSPGNANWRMKAPDASGTMRRTVLLIRDSARYDDELNGDNL